MAISKEEVKILTTKRWRILAVSCLINLCIGSMYAWSVLAAPMADELQVASLAIVFSIANAVGFITMIIGGLLNDKYGPRWVMFTGGIMWIGFSIAGILGPTILTKVHASTGQYRMAFVIAMCIAVIGLVLSFVYRKLSKS